MDKELIQQPKKSQTLATSQKITFRVILYPDKYLDKYPEIEGT